MARKQLAAFAAKGVLPLDDTAQVGKGWEMAGFEPTVADPKQPLRAPRNRGKRCGGLGRSLVNCLSTWLHFPHKRAGGRRDSNPRPTNPKEPPRSPRSEEIVQKPWPKPVCCSAKLSYALHKPTSVLGSGGTRTRDLQINEGTPTVTSERGNSAEVSAEAILMLCQLSYASHKPAPTNGGGNGGIRTRDRSNSHITSDRGNRAGSVYALPAELHSPYSANY